MIRDLCSSIPALLPARPFLRKHRAEEVKGKERRKGIEQTESF